MEKIRRYEEVIEKFLDGNSSHDEVSNMFPYTAQVEARARKITEERFGVVLKKPEQFEEPHVPPMCYVHSVAPDWLEDSGDLLLADHPEQAIALFDLAIILLRHKEHRTPNNDAQILRLEDKLAKA